MEILAGFLAENLGSLVEKMQSLVLVFVGIWAC